MSPPFHGAVTTVTAQNAELCAMSRARQLPDRDYQALKAATRQLINAAGGMEAAAAISRGNHQTMSRYGSAHLDNVDRYIPIDVLADLESECGQPVLTAALARMSGHLLVPEPSVVHSGSALGVITARALKETSEVFVALAEGLGDGKICVDDARKISKEIDEALSKLAALRLQVHAEARVES